MWAHTSLASGKQSDTIKHRVATVGYTIGIYEKGALEYPITEEKARADNASSEDEELDKGILTSSRTVWHLQRSYRSQCTELSSQ